MYKISRKFWLAVALIISATILLIYNIINSDNWVHVVEVIGASYIAGNVAHSAVSSMRFMRVEKRRVDIDDVEK